MRKFTAGQKQRMMSNLLRSPEGRARIAANITEPLRELRDYSAIGRKALLIDELPDGALPIYDKDPVISGYVVAEEGDSVQQIVKGDRIVVPTFELASYPKVPFTQVRERRFDVPKRIREKTRTEIFRAEDRLIFQVFTKAAARSTINVPMSVAIGDFNIAVLADAFARIERHGNRVDKVYMNAMNFSVLRKAGRDYMDFESQRELLRTGYMGVLWGASVYVSPEIPTDEIFLCAEPEYLGVMPIRMDLTVLPADDPGRRQYGWSVFEAIGIGLHNPDRGLQSIKLTGQGVPSAPIQRTTTM